MKVFCIKNLIVVGLFLISLSPLLWGCRNKPADANTNASPPPPQVTVRRPMTKDVEHYRQFSGTTEAFETVTIRARVEGYLKNIHFIEGAMVKQGDLLFTIDDRLYQAGLDEAQSELAMRQAELKLAQATKTRKEKALQDRAVSEVAVIDARAQLSKAQASAAAAKAAVRTAALNFSYTRVEAPISGRIGRCLVDKGNLVGAGERTELTTIIRNDPIHVSFTISERDWIRFQSRRTSTGTANEAPVKVNMGLAGGTDFPHAGHLDFIDNHVDAATGTINVRGIFANPKQQILPGLFARVQIAMGEITDALLVPGSALGRDQQGHFLLVANNANISEYRPVTAGPIVDGMRVITSGLKADERVIVNGLQKTRPGGPITPTETAPGAASPKASKSKPSV